MSLASAGTSGTRYRDAPSTTGRQENEAVKAPGSGTRRANRPSVAANTSPSTPPGPITRAMLACAGNAPSGSADDTAVVPAPTVTTSVPTSPPRSSIWMSYRAVSKRGEGCDAGSRPRAASTLATAASNSASGIGT